MKNKVLLIDDSVTIHRVVDLSVDAEKHDVIKVFSKEDAATKLQSEQFDYILLDNKLDNANVGEYVKSLREAQPKANIILLVGAFDRFDKNDLSRIGANDYLVKPFDHQSLGEKLSPHDSTMSADFVDKIAEATLMRDNDNDTASDTSDLIAPINTPKPTADIMKTSYLDSLEDTSDDDLLDEGYAEDFRDELSFTAFSDEQEDSNNIQDEISLEDNNNIEEEKELDLGLESNEEIDIKPVFEPKFEDEMETEPEPELVFTSEEDITEEKHTEELIFMEEFADEDPVTEPIEEQIAEPVEIADFTENITEEPVIAEEKTEMLMEENKSQDLQFFSEEDFHDEEIPQDEEILQEEDTLQQTDITNQDDILPQEDTLQQAEDILPQEEIFRQENILQQEDILPQDESEEISFGDMFNEIDNIDKIEETEELEEVAVAGIMEGLNTDNDFSDKAQDEITLDEIQEVAPETAPVETALTEKQESIVKEAEEYAPVNARSSFGGITISISRDEIMAMLGNAIDKQFLEEAIKDVVAANMKDIVTNIVPAIAEKYIKEEIERLKNDE